MNYWNKLIQEILNTGEVAIYGAGLMGRTVKTCLENAPYGIKVKIFIVESLKNNPDHIDGIPVIDIVHAWQYQDVLLLVALHEKNMAGALERLIDAGFRYVRPLSFDSDEWSDIRGNWFQYVYSGRPEKYISLDEVMAEKFRIYVVHSTADRVVKERSINHSFETPIQVGAALTEKRIAMVLDNKGDNISEKNKKFCELTALYWIWKNDRTKYIGLSHYRRRFDISEEMAMWLPESDIDVVLTVPVLNLQGVRQQYCNDHIESDWNTMMEAVEYLFPEYLDTADRVQKGNYYYAYNMFITRKEILNQYCEWLFPILFRCEEIVGDRGDTYQDRYPGFLAERLMTIFFEHHKHEYKIAVAKKHFIAERWLLSDQEKQEI